MKIGVFTVLFSQRPFEEALDYIKEAGCEAVEIGAGGYPGDAHATPPRCWPTTRRASSSRTRSTSRGLEISALSCHGNPLHPNAEIAEAHDRDFPRHGPAGAGARRAARSSPSPAAPAVRRRWSRTG